VRFAAITLCVASQRVFIVVSVYFVMTRSENYWIHPRVCLCVCARARYVYVRVPAVERRVEFILAAVQKSLLVVQQAFVSTHVY
jgi:hypothetical protein